MTNPLDCLTPLERQRLMDLTAKQKRGARLTPAEVRYVLDMQDRIVAAYPSAATPAQTAAAARLRSAVGK